QERLGDPVLEHHVVDRLEAEDHQAVLGERARRRGVDRGQVRRERRDLGADRRLLEVRAEAVVRVRLEQQRLAAAPRALAGDRRGDGAPAHPALADDEDQPALEQVIHGYFDAGGGGTGAGVSSTTTATPLASAERQPRILRSVQIPLSGVISTLMSTTL